MSKKQQAREDRTPYGKMCPAWLELVDGGYRVKADAALAVRKIFEWCASGLGTFGILNRLNQEGVPPIGRTSEWERSYVRKILDSRAVLGEYQPMKGSRAPNRVPEGDPIPNYYPAIIDEPLWHAAQQAIQARMRRSGRPATSSKNAFSGLLYDALDGEKLHVSGTRGYKYLVSAAAIQKRTGAQWRTFSLDAFQAAVLSQLKELAASDLFADPGAGKLAVLQGRLGDVEKRLAVALAKFEADPESPTWADRVSQYDKEKRALVKELAEASREASNPLSGSWAEAVQLMAEDDPQRLRAALFTTVERIYSLFVPRGRSRLAAVQVWFKGGQHRDYLILHQGGRGNATSRTEGKCWCCSLADAAALGPLDLRKPADARKLETLLAGVDLETLTAAMRELPGLSASEEKS